MERKVKSGVDISIIVLSYNTREITRKCLQAARMAVAAYKGTVETIVVENNSTDGSVEMIKKEFKWVRLLEQKTNTGFSLGNNIAMKEARGKYLLLINSDLYLNKDTLSKCVEFISNTSDCDVLGCQLRYVDGKEQISWGYLPDLTNVLEWWVLGGLMGKKPVHAKWNPQKPMKVGWIMGAFMFMKREVAEKTGGFDEKIFMYMEEVDWLYRINKAGFGVYYVPDFWVTHVDKGSSGGKSANPLLREAAGLRYYMNKHFPSQAFLADIYIRIGAGMRWVYCVFKNKELAHVYWKIVLNNK